MTLVWLVAMSPACSRFQSIFVSSFIAAIGFLILTTLVSARAVVEDTGQQYPHEYNYTVNHPEICNSSQDIHLLIMVHTACHHAKARLAVRHTWGSLVKRRDVQLLFLLGSPTEDELQQQIFDEDQLFGDILQENFLDTYHNLTLKTIMMVKWVTRHCSNARYVLKIDDDCFMNPDNLFAFLNQNLSESAIFGRVWRGVAPFRNKESKWYISYDLYPESKFPDFASGPSYLLTQKAVPLLYATTLTTKSIYLEDVYLNGICAAKANIPRVHKPGLFLPSSTVNSVKTIRKDVLTSHEFPSRQLRLLWWLLYDSRKEKLDYVLVSGGQKTLVLFNETRTITTTITNGTN